jgi:AcrR family transcriptional regulator
MRRAAEPPAILDTVQPGSAPNSTTPSRNARRGRKTDRPLQERAVRTRESLLVAAASTFERVGYSGATLEEIVLHADATKGALYFHFRSKADLAHAVLAAHYQQWEQILQDAAAADLDAFDTLGFVVHALARANQTDPIARAGVRLGDEREQLESDAPTPPVDWVDYVTKLLRKGHRDGSVRRDVNTAASARVVVASFYGVDRMSARLTGRDDLIKRVDEWWTMLGPSLLAQPT